MSRDAGERLLCPISLQQPQNGARGSPIFSLLRLQWPDKSSLLCWKIDTSSQHQSIRHLCDGPGRRLLSLAPLATSDRRELSSVLTFDPLSSRLRNTGMWKDRVCLRRDLHLGHFLFSSVTLGSLARPVANCAAVVNYEAVAGFSRFLFADADVDAFLSSTSTGG